MRHIIAIDPGIDTTAVLFGQYDDIDKDMLIFDEIYRERISLTELAGMIKARLAHYKITKPIFLIDPSSVREEQTSQSSIWKDLRDLGIVCRPAINDVNLGIMRANKMFKSGQLKISAYLKNIIAELTEYYMDEKTGKPKTGQKDHLLDCLRYIINSLTASESDKTVSREHEIAMLRKRRENLPLYNRQYNGVKKDRRYLTSL